MVCGNCPGLRAWRVTALTLGTWTAESWMNRLRAALLVTTACCAVTTMVRTELAAASMMHRVMMIMLVMVATMRLDMAAAMLAQLRVLR